MTSWTTTKAQPRQSDQGTDEKQRSAIDALKEVSEQIKRLKNPTGDKNSPGRTCREIAAGAEDPTALKNGMFWVDPNGGGVSDAIEVFCRFADKLDATQTCLVPNTEKYENQAWFKTKPRTNDGMALFAEKFAESEFSYKTVKHKSQVKFLQYNAKQARQRVTIHCKNMNAIFDSQGMNYKNSVKLISFDEEEMNVHAKKAFRYKVIEDNCQDKNGEWGRAVIEVRGRKPRMQRLPILDVGFRDVGADQEFGIELGRACFSS